MAGCAIISEVLCSRLACGGASSGWRAILFMNGDDRSIDLTTGEEDPEG